MTRALTNSFRSINRTNKLILLVQLGSLILLAGLALSRLILSPIGFICFLAALAVATVFSILSLASLFGQKHNISAKVHSAFSLILLVAAPISIQHRADLLGFDLFLIPSSSMSPSIVPGDVVVVDTLSLKLKHPNTSSVVVFYHAGFGQTMIKRVVRADKFDFDVQGDNKSDSINNLFLKNIPNSMLRGEAKMVLLNIKTRKFRFYRI